MTWQTFVQAHWPALVAADFFTTEVWTMRGLVTYYTALVIRAAIRAVSMCSAPRHTTPRRGLCHADSTAGD
jgi:hypothetical protein